jgi:hypothetical protein
LPRLSRGGRPDSPVSTAKNYFTVTTLAEVRPYWFVESRVLSGFGEGRTRAFPGHDSICAKKGDSSESGNQSRIPLVTVTGNSYQRLENSALYPGFSLLY